ncbi:hypothetical protein GEMRC1_004532 [Eukaryota sp. GEM-RC1]
MLPTDLTQSLAPQLESLEDDLVDMHVPSSSNTHDETSFLSGTFSFTLDFFLHQAPLFSEKNLLTDTAILYDDLPFHCHSFVVSSFSSYLKEQLFRSSSVEFPSLPFLSDPDLFFMVLSTLYGQPLPVTSQSFSILSIIASIPQFQELTKFVTERISKGLDNFDDNKFQLRPDVLASKIVESCVSDVRVSYKNTDITLNSVFVSHHFFTSFTSEFADSNIRKFEYSTEFPGVADESIEFNISNILDFFQLSVYFQVDELKLACKEFLSYNSFSEHELVYLLQISNERNQFNFLVDNIQIFKIPSSISHEPIPLSVSFTKFLLPYIDFYWLFNCLMKLYKSDGFLATELQPILTAAAVREFALFALYEIIELLFHDSQFTSVLVEWTVGIFKNVENFANIPPSWFLVTLCHVDGSPLYSKYLKFLVNMFPLVLTSEYLKYETNFSCSSICMDLFCSKLTSDYCLWLARSLVNSWKKSTEFNDSWTIDSFVKCLKSIPVADANKCQFLNIIAELNTDEVLEPFINSFVSKNSLELLSSREKELTVWRNLVDPMKEVCQALFQLL